jgi:two-component system, NtrC family, response regulator AtoC
LLKIQADGRFYIAQPADIGPGTEGIMNMPEIGGDELQEHSQPTHRNARGSDGIDSPVMREVFAAALRHHENRSTPVLIEGESGVGRELVARMIHRGPGGSLAPFMTLDCGGIPETVFEEELFGSARGSSQARDHSGRHGALELARGGTLFLREIGAMSREAQTRLLRTLQDNVVQRVGGSQRVPLDVRIIASTSRNLTRETDIGRFRAELLRRIGTATIRIPPLRERREEIIPLSRRFLEQFANERRLPLKLLSQEAADFLRNQSWPGNVRQLRNAIDRAAFCSDHFELYARDFTFLTGEGTEPTVGERSFHYEFPRKPVSLYEIQEVFVRRALALFEGNKTRTAGYLGISINKLRRILGEM